ncbi:MAG TPA: hypothetical protein VFW45_09555 [Candidatus Polarisedimenticolia bacterium]|nr:hypothetical protein [Candidatus Polarisedimenticolia bacterium]
MFAWKQANVDGSQLSEVQGFESLQRGVPLQKKPWEPAQTSFVVQGFPSLQD